MTPTIGLIAGIFFVSVYYFGKYVGMRKMANIVSEELNKGKWFWKEIHNESNRYTIQKDYWNNFKSWI